MHPILQTIRSRLSSSSDPFGLIVSIPIRPEAVARFAEVARRSALATRDEPGNQRYEFYRLISEPNQFRLIEQWRSFDDLVKHFETPHLREELATIEACSDGEGSIEVLSSLPA